MKKAKEYRQAAWENLRGKWGTMALATFVYTLIMAACGILSIIYIGSIAALLLTGAFLLGLAAMALKVCKNEEVHTGDLFCGFEQFGSSLALYLLINIFTILWSLLFLIPGIIKAYSYSMSYFVLTDHPELSANEARKRSMQLMRGKKWKLFCLQISFIGWGFLILLTLGILSFWVVPYMQTATAEFYTDLLAEQGELTA